MLVVAIVSGYVRVPLVVDRTEPIKESMELVVQALKKESRVHQAMEPIVLLKEVDTYYLTFEVHFTIEFTDPMESLVAQSNILAVIGQLFPSKANSLQDPGVSPNESVNMTSTLVKEPGKLQFSDDLPWPPVPDSAASTELRTSRVPLLLRIPADNAEVT